jgi:hypothetical protein
MSHDKREFSSWWTETNQKHQAGTSRRGEGFRRERPYGNDRRRRRGCPSIARHGLPLLLQPNDLVLEAATPRVALRVMAEAVRWGKRGARVNSISPGIIVTPMAKGRTDRGRWGGLPAHDRALPGRARRHSGRGRNRWGAPDKPDGRLITGSDFLMDGGVTAAYRFWRDRFPSQRVGLPRTR